MKKINLALLSGGISSEREVSINSGNQVYEALDKNKYNIMRYDPKTDLEKLVADASQIDAALIILHGPHGEDGTVQGLLDLLHIPYQGSGVLGSAMAMNKAASKLLYEKAGIPIPSYTILESGTPVDAGACISEIGLPMVVKPVVGGSSVGMSIIHAESEFQTALDLAFAEDNAVMLETYIKGVELTGGVIGNRELEALPLIEIVPDENHAFFDYEAKYTAGVTQEICPARVDEKITQAAQYYAKKAHQALFCRGYSRTDMILQDGNLFVLETNTIPGMTATSLLPQAAQVGGISFSRLLDRLIELSLENE